jgi:hypothetical protein
MFGNVRDGEMRLNDAGKMLHKWWDETAIKFKNIELDESVIMPNHFHCVIFIDVWADLRVCSSADIVSLLLALSVLI